MPEPTGLNDASLFCVAKQERKSEVIECGVEVDDFRVDDFCVRNEIYLRYPSAILRTFSSSFSSKE